MITLAKAVRKTTTNLQHKLDGHCILGQGSTGRLCVLAHALRHKVSQSVIYDFMLLDYGCGLLLDEAGALAQIFMNQVWTPIFINNKVGWPNGKALDYESRDCRFDPCVGQHVQQHPIMGVVPFVLLYLTFLVAKCK